VLNFICRTELNSSLSDWKKLQVCVYGACHRSCIGDDGTTVAVGFGGGGAGGGIGWQIRRSSHHPIGYSHARDPAWWGAGDLQPVSRALLERPAPVQQARECRALLFAR